MTAVIDSKEPVCLSNQDEIVRFVTFQSTSSRSVNTLKKYGARLRAFARYLNKPWREATRDDIARALADMAEKHINFKTGEFEPGGLKQNTLRDTKIILLMFYSWLYELPRGEYPPCVSWVEVGREEEKQVERDEIITADDLRRIIAATPHARNKAVIAVLWATGVRASEFLGLRVKDLESVEGVWGLNIRGTKTVFSQRWVSITDERVLELLHAWISARPNHGDAQAWLWVKENGERFSDRHLADVLKEAQKRAGIFKPYNPHHYRHSWATLNARKWPYPTFCRMGGWALNSRVPKRYIHDNKHDDARAVAASLTDESEREGLLIREVTRMVAEFISKPEVHARWKDYLAKREGAAAVRELAVKLAPECRSTDENRECSKRAPQNRAVLQQKKTRAL